MADVLTNPGDEGLAPYPKYCVRRETLLLPCLRSLPELINIYQRDLKWAINLINFNCSLKVVVPMEACMGICVYPRC